jgi:adenylate kinase
LIAERLQQEDLSVGWLLDGFPRTVPQAEGLVSLLQKISHRVGAVVSLEVPDEEIVRRLSGRVTCLDCGYVTNKDNIAPDADVRCPQCGGGPMTQRDDDKEETVRSRLQVYRSQTYPAAEALGRHYPLKRVDGLGSPADVSQRIASALQTAD